MNKKAKLSLSKQASTLCHKIEAEYKKLTNDIPDFFQAYHNFMSREVDYARDLTGEVDHYVEQGHLKLARKNIKDLRVILSYCKAVIQLQEYTANMLVQINLNSPLK